MSLTLKEVGSVVDRLYRRLQSRRPDAERSMAYFRGTQGALKFATEDFRQASEGRYDGFSDNWCQSVATAGADRTSVIGLKLPGGSLGRSSPAEQKLWGALQANDVQAQLAMAFLQAPIQRRAFVSVWGRMSGPDAGAPVVAVESATQAIVEYDPEYRWDRRFGLKVFCDDQFEYATLSSPDEIWSLRRALGSGAIRQASGLVVPGVAVPGGTVMPGLTGQQWEVIGEPAPNHLGLVPLVELPYRPLLDGEPLSDIDGAMATQDAINLHWAYCFNAADYASLPARVVMGQAPPKVPVLDENGIKIGERPVDSKELTKGRILWLTGQTTTIGKWDAANLEPFTSIIEQLVGHLAAQSRTPPYYLMSKSGMSNLAPEAVKAADNGLVSKVKSAERHYEGRLQEILQLVALQMQDSGLADQAKNAQIRWENPWHYSEAQRADAFQKRLAAGYPFEWLLIEDGYSPEEIETIMSLREAERARAVADAEAAGEPPPVYGPAGELASSAAPVKPLSGSEAPQQDSDGVVAPK